VVIEWRILAVYRLRNCGEYVADLCAKTSSNNSGNDLGRQMTAPKPLPERMEAIKEIIDLAIQQASSYDWQTTNYDQIRDEAVAQINLLLVDFVNEVVGEDEADMGNSRATEVVPTRNQLRAEIKQRANQLLKRGTEL